MDESAYSQPAAASAGSTVGSLIFLLIGLAFLVAVYVGLWRMFTKAGKPGWASLIPFYNAYVMLKIVGRPGWWLLLFFVPLVNIVIGILVTVELAESFGKSVMFAIFGLLIFSPIGVMMLGFGKAQYVGPVADPNFHPGNPAGPAAPLPSQAPPATPPAV